MTLLQALGAPKKLKKRKEYKISNINKLDHLKNIHRITNRTKPTLTKSFQSPKTNLQSIYIGQAANILFGGWF